MSATDWELLQQYRRDQTETAFAELVCRHVNLVYSAALRQNARFAWLRCVALAGPGVELPSDSP